MIVIQASDGYLDLVYTVVVSLTIGCLLAWLIDRLGGDDD